MSTPLSSGVSATGASAGAATPRVDFAAIIIVPPTAEIGLAKTTSIPVILERHTETGHQGDPPSDVRLSATNLPAGVTALFDPVVAFGESTLFLTSTSAVVPGVYQIQIHGEAVSSSHQAVRGAPINLSVIPFSLSVPSGLPVRA